MSQKKMDLYEVVGLSKTATRQQIADAIDELRIEFHPDSIRTDPDRAQKEARYKLLDEAKQVLLNNDKRAAYDRGGYDAVARMSSSGSSPSPYASSGPSSPQDDLRPPADFSMGGLADFAKRTRRMDGSAAPTTSTEQPSSPASRPVPVSGGGDDFASRMAAKRQQSRTGAAPTPAAPAVVPATQVPSTPREFGYADAALSNVRSVLNGPGEIPLDVLTAFKQNLDDTLAAVGQKIKRTPSGPKP